MPGLRIWLVDPERAHFLMIPSHAIVFTEEERAKYAGNGFERDGSDVPTLRGVLGRVGAWDTDNESESESRYKCKWESAVDGHEAMETMMGHFMEQMGEGGRRS